MTIIEAKQSKCLRASYVVTLTIFSVISHSFMKFSKHVTEQIFVHCVTKSTTFYGSFVKECIRSSYALHLACKVSALESTSELARS